MMHAKAMVVDGIWSIFGSANFDNRSLELNDELNVAVSSRDLAGRFLADFDHDLRASAASRSRGAGGSGRCCRRRGSTSGAISGRCSDRFCDCAVVRLCGCAVVRLSGGPVFQESGASDPGLALPSPAMRIRFLAIALLTFLGAPFLASGQTAAGPPSRPNIVWISNEDMSPRLGAYGDRVARTPVLDRLASESIRYHARVLVGARLRAEPRGDHHRHAPDADRRSPHADDRGSRARAARTVSRGAAVLRQGVSRVSARRRLLHDQSRQDRLPVRRAVHDLGRPAPPRTGAIGATSSQPFFSVFNLGHAREPGLSGSARGRESRPSPARPRRVPPYYPDTPVVREDLARSTTTSPTWTPRSARSCASCRRTVSPTTPSSSTGAITATACRDRSARSTTRVCECR